MSCSKVDEFRQPPELTPLEDGFKTSAAIGYCISVATRALTGQSLPPNVIFTKRTTDGYSNSGLIHISVDDSAPVPFNSKIGNITMAGLWNENSGGVISIMFSDFDLVNGDFKFYGIHTIPIMVRSNTNEIASIFAQQDIVIGEGSDTLMNLSLSRPKFDAELNRLNTPAPTDAFVAVQQNVWHLTVTPNTTATNFLDDDYRISGGGQIAEARSDSGGILYHAMINTKFNFTDCSKNPKSGTAFIQNFKAGSSLDFGTILIDFHSTCNGSGKVTLATGKYAATNGKDLQLNWQ
ncbi:MAG TPA: hypothetical protein VGD40_01030 [Chryseosolibacter sp.]